MCQIYQHGNERIDSLSKLIRLKSSPITIGHGLIHFLTFETRLKQHIFFSFNKQHLKNLRNVEYLLLAVMSELSTVLCDRVLGLWLQVHGSRVSTESCRGGAVADGPCGGRR